MSFKSFKSFRYFEYFEYFEERSTLDIRKRKLHSHNDLPR